MNNQEEYGRVFNIDPSITPMTPTPTPTPTICNEPGFGWQVSPGPTDWDHLTMTVFEYPPTNRPAPLTIGINSPGSTGSEVATPTSWAGGFQGSDYGEYSNDEVNESFWNNQRLPSVNTAFSFSRNFGNTGNYFEEPEQVQYQEFNHDYQDYQDCGYGEELQLTLPASVDLTSQLEESPEHLNSLQAVDEFDLSLIRGDPTALLTNDAIAVTSFGEDNRYPVGHLMSREVSVGNYKTSQQSNQVVLSQCDGLMLDKHNEGQH